MALLEVKNIKKNFGDNEVLKGIDFSLEKGEVLAIIGSSGSGKTTLLRCLNFLETADIGQIIVNNEVLFDADAPKKEQGKNLRKKRLHFGLVFQSFNLFPHFNIINNVMLASKLLAEETLKSQYKQIYYDNKLRKKDDVSNPKLSRKQIAILKSQAKAQTLGNIRSNSVALLERVGLGDRQKAYPCELSGGQQQRVAIARALALSPDILCFDEPTSALDPELTGEVLKVIRNLKSGDSTMIVVTHEMDFAKNVADKVIFMANGIIEEEGTPDDIFKNPKSEKLKAFLQKSLEEIV